MVPDSVTDDHIEVQQILARLNFYVHLEFLLFGPIKLYLPPVTYQMHMVPVTWEWLY